MLSGDQGTTEPCTIGAGRLQESVVAPGYNVGILGYLAGPAVYIFDEDSLANPIGSHIRVHDRGRPGHEKPIDVQWMFGRYLPPGVTLPATSGASGQTVDPTRVAAARAALLCAPLDHYLNGIPAPLSLHLALSNIFHSITYSTFTFDETPTAAQTELCSH